MNTDFIKYNQIDSNAIDKIFSVGKYGFIIIENNEYLEIENYIIANKFKYSPVYIKNDESTYKKCFIIYANESGFSALNDFYNNLCVKSYVQPVYVFMPDDNKDLSVFENMYHNGAPYCYTNRIRRTHWGEIFLK